MTSDLTVVDTDFASLGLHPAVLSALEKLNFTVPTAVQEEVIPLFLEETSDIVALAQTGTGKTAAFGLPLVHLISPGKRTSALVLAPTRELCLQITQDLEKYALYSSGLNIVAVYGGASIRDQQSLLKKGADIIVATPGRLIDLQERGSVFLDDIKYLVLDEADEMLNMGFRDELEMILKNCPRERMTCLFSATMPSEIRGISKKYMRNPREISIAVNQAHANIEHKYYVIRDKNRYEAVRRILDAEQNVYGILFAQTRALCQEIAEKLIKDGYNADAIHGDLSQAQRDKVMGRFRQRSLQILVATDVAARGIDVQDITHVIHYTLPVELEIYTHRSGRTARAGKTGISLALVTSGELRKIERLTRLVKADFKPSLIPSGEEIVEARIGHFLEDIFQTHEDDQLIEPHLHKFYQQLKNVTREELIRSLAYFGLKSRIGTYENAQDINEYPGESGGQGDRKGKREGSGRFEKFFISIGSLDGLDKGNMLRWFREIGLKDVEVGKIKIHKTHTFFDADTEKTELLMKVIPKQRVNRRPVRLEVREK